MKERPILFNGEMVRAILAGRKTMTRRVMKPQPHDGVDAVKWQDIIVTGMNTPDQSGFAMMRDGIIESEAVVCPYGMPGDRLWVRETFADLKGMGFADFPSNISYRADCGPDSLDAAKSYGVKWRPSIFMPRWASRITLEITGVRVERIKKITWDDCISEGTRGVNVAFWFQLLWDRIYAKRGYGWDVNPWVWVVEFRRV